MARCSVCGTTNPDDFHTNSLIGYDIALGLEKQGCDYWDVDTKTFLCQRCYYKKIGKFFNEDTWKRYLEHRKVRHELK